MSATLAIAHRDATRAGFAVAPVRQPGGREGALTPPANTPGATAERGDGGDDLLSTMPSRYTLVVANRAGGE